MGEIILVLTIVGFFINGWCSAVSPYKTYNENFFHKWIRFFIVWGCSLVILMGIYCLV